MKVLMSKKVLADALDRMKSVATRGIKRDFDLAHRVTITSSKNKTQFLSTNGHLNAIWTIDAQNDAGYKCEDDGKITVDVSRIFEIVQSIGGPKLDTILCLQTENDNLIIKDSLSKAKKQAQMQTLAKFHDFSIKKPDTGFAYEFKTKSLQSDLVNIGRYFSRDGYKVKYQMICLHFLQKETRMICGDGMRFAILTYKLPKDNPNVKTTDGIKYLMPVDQAGIISSVIRDSDITEIIYEDEQHCYIKARNGIEMFLVGIPNENYIPYEKHAYCTGDAKIILDVLRNDMVEAMGVVNSVRDKEMEVEGSFHSSRFNYADNNLEFIVDENKYQCEFNCTVQAYVLSDLKKFSSAYASVYLNDVTYSSNKPTLRFYCIDEKRSIICETVDVDAPVGNVAPTPKYKDEDPRLVFFFAAVIPEEN